MFVFSKIFNENDDNLLIIRGDMKGKITVVGIGPGNRDTMTFKAFKRISEADVIVGYKTYIDLIEDLLDGKKVLSSGMRKEYDRCVEALEEAASGKVVAVVSSGDPGIYGMAGIMLEVINEKGSDIEVEIVPGVSSVNASASVLGAPLMHDFVCISLSDLLTDWELIKKRVLKAAEGDFVIALYNPKSKTRITQIVEARDILLSVKSGDTPVGIVNECLRINQSMVITDLTNMLNHQIDMTTTIIIGNSNTFVKNGKIITPRGYKL